MKAIIALVLFLAAKQGYALGALMWVNAAYVSESAGLSGAVNTGFYF
jgi:hypothetical protein